MPRMIEYWLVRNWRTGWYARLMLDGGITETKNTKRAWRFMAREDATQLASRLGWCWSATKVQFPGDEPVA